MKRILPLAALPEGCKGKVVKVEAGLGLVRRLGEMGFVKGARVKMLRSTSGPIMVQLYGSRIALGRGVASRIIVEVEDFGELEKA